MTKYDHNLIYLRSENGRLGLKELSRYLKKTPQRLKYSISVLEKEKILRNPYCLIDYSYFSLILFRVYFRGSYIGEKDKQRIIEQLSENPYVVSIYEVGGEYDLSVEFLSPNPSKFNKELKKIITSIATLKDYKVILNLITYLYPRYYLSKSEPIQNISAEKVVGGDREKESFNANELLMLNHVNTDPTARYTQLAKKTNLNAKTVKSILKSLTKRHIIKGVKFIVDTNKLGISKIRLFLKLHNMTIENESKLMEYLLKSNEIVQVNKTIGDWDMEVDIESLDKTRIRQIIVKLREHCPDIIERYNTVDFYDLHKKAYLPQFLFKEIKE